MQRTLEDQLELHVLRQSEFLAQAGSDHEGCGGGDGCAHGRVLFIFGCNTGFSAYECGFGCGEYRVFLFGVGGADFAFAIVEDADGMDSGGVDQMGYKWNPAGWILSMWPRICAPIGRVAPSAVASGSRVRAWNCFPTLSSLVEMMVCRETRKRVPRGAASGGAS